MLQTNTIVATEWISPPQVSVWMVITKHCYDQFSLIYQQSGHMNVLVMSVLRTGWCTTQDILIVLICVRG
jgi:hypothetical protein